MWCLAPLVSFSVREFPELGVLVVGVVALTVGVSQASRLECAQWVPGGPAPSRVDPLSSVVPHEGL